jgi:hypothetical protein
MRPHRNQQQSGNKPSNPVKCFDLWQHRRHLQENFHPTKFHKLKNRDLAWQRQTQTEVCRVAAVVPSLGSTSAVQLLLFELPAELFLAAAFPMANTSLQTLPSMSATPLAIIFGVDVLPGRFLETFLCCIAHVL